MGIYNFSSWLQLKEAFEQDLFDPHPDQEPISSSHEVRKLTKKGDFTKTPHYSKASIADDLQVANEYIAYRIYKLFGLSVASSAHLVVDDENKLRLVTSQVGGKQIPGHADPVAHLKNTDFKKGFFVDAFLGNWDVVGNAPRYNVFINNGQTSRIDTGGLDFRAMGGRKGAAFSPKVAELQSFGGIGGPAMTGQHAPEAFAGLKDNPAELKQAADIFKRVPWSAVESEIKNVEDEIKALAQEHNMPSLLQKILQYIDHILPTLKSRYQHVIQQLQQLGV